MPSNRLTKCLVVVLIVTFSLATLQVSQTEGEPTEDSWHGYVTEMKPSAVSPMPSPSSTPSQEPTSTPETKQPMSFPTIWIVAIAALVAVVILELIIIYFLKVKRTKS